MATLRPALLLLIILTLITGGVYPLLATLLGQWWFPAQANGSLIVEDGKVRGSELIGQDFTNAKYFQGRPSATSDSPYNPMASGGSNLAASNPELDKEVKARVSALRAANPEANPAVPVDLVTTSASGLDGQLSPEATAWQIPRVAKARNLPVEQIARLVAENTTTPLVNFIGMPVVNIVKLNLALDHLQAK
ncbi:potassium-transporting ATPase subunit KdpC [Enterobacter sp. Ap-916]|uniref:potassium-transporting ATPase subunit KdpC n=1 Tax=Enterobacteriaceae TaxID=543 RepID=UPI00141F0BAE|nr:MULTISPECIES: potassium-transporting ATPase subunit KdpC [Enterobacteriaceae]NIF59599.1 potassium-transporting ATPase subunit KdpC [Enterobacter sp. Ap-867]NIG30675.1 potassium-transporting ATPase subunit KdpC [Enterobacter sp. Ap-916]